MTKNTKHNHKNIINTPKSIKVLVFLIFFIIKSDLFHLISLLIIRDIVISM